MKVLLKVLKWTTDKTEGKRKKPTFVRVCTGKGNYQGFGCLAILSLSSEDLYHTTTSCAGHETERYITFCCPVCGTETDISLPTGFNVGGNRPERADGC